MDGATNGSMVEACSSRREKLSNKQNLFNKSWSMIGSATAGFRQQQINSLQPKHSSCVTVLQARKPMPLTSSNKRRLGTTSSGSKANMWSIRTEEGLWRPCRGGSTAQRSAAMGFFLKTGSQLSLKLLLEVIQGKPCGSARKLANTSRQNIWTTVKLNNNHHSAAYSKLYTTQNSNDQAW